MTTTYLMYKDILNIVAHDFCLIRDTKTKSQIFLFDSNSLMLKYRFKYTSMV